MILWKYIHFILLLLLPVLFVILLWLFEFDFIIIEFNKEFDIFAFILLLKSFGFFNIASPIRYVCPLFDSFISFVKTSLSII